MWLMCLLYMYYVHGDAVHIQGRLRPFIQRDLVCVAGLCTCQGRRSLKKEKMVPKFNCFRSKITPGAWHFVRGIVRCRTMSKSSLVSWAASRLWCETKRIRLDALSGACDQMFIRKSSCSVWTFRVVVDCAQLVEWGEVVICQRREAPDGSKGKEHGGLQVVLRYNMTPDDFQSIHGNSRSRRNLTHLCEHGVWSWQQSQSQGPKLGECTWAKSVLKQIAYCRWIVREGVGA